MGKESNNFKILKQVTGKVLVPLGKQVRRTSWRLYSWSYTCSTSIETLPVQFNIQAYHTVKWYPSKQLKNVEIQLMSRSITRDLDLGFSIGLGEIARQKMFRVKIKQNLQNNHVQTKDAQRVQRKWKRRRVGNRHFLDTVWWFISFVSHNSFHLPKEERL